MLAFNATQRIKYATLKADEVQKHGQATSAAAATQCNGQRGHLSLEGEGHCFDDTGHVIHMHSTCAMLHASSLLARVTAGAAHVVHPHPSLSCRLDPATGQLHCWAEVWGGWRREGQVGGRVVVNKAPKLAAPDVLRPRAPPPLQAHCHQRRHRGDRHHHCTRHGMGGESAALVQVHSR